MDSFDFGSMLGGGGGGSGKTIGRSEAHAESTGDVIFGEDTRKTNWVPIIAIGAVGAVLLLFGVALLSRR